MRLKLFTLGLFFTSISLANAPEPPTRLAGEARFPSASQKKKKDLAWVEIADIREGLSLIFNAESIPKGRYSLNLSDNCRHQDPQKIGDFETVSGNISSEFIKTGLSLGNRFPSVLNKALVLILHKKGQRPQVMGCALIQSRDDHEEPL